MERTAINRRSALKMAASGVGALCLPGCYGSIGRTGAASPLALSEFVPVRSAENRLIRAVAGLRPYRASGFRVDVERLGEKLIIHNYGHGGAGVTLSWGTARLALEHGLGQPNRQAAVLGCGAVGLATARLLQDHGFSVTIYAASLPPNTTSNIAGALWSPVTVAAYNRREGPFAETLARAARYAHRYFQSLVGPHYGVRWLPLYLLSEDPTSGLPWTWALTPELYRARRIDPREHSFPFAGAWEANAMLIEPDSYLRALLADFRMAGGEIIIRQFPGREAVLALAENVIFNCTGLGAKALFGDDELTPVKGQLAFLLPQPEVEYMYIAGNFYMFPRQDGIVLGGTHDSGQFSEEPDPNVTMQLVEAHRKISAGMRRSPRT